MNGTLTRNFLPFKLKCYCISLRKFYCWLLWEKKILYSVFHFRACVSIGQLLQIYIHVSFLCAWFDPFRYSIGTRFVCFNCARLFCFADFPWSRLHVRNAHTVPLTYVLLTFNFWKFLWPAVILKQCNIYLYTCLIIYCRIQHS